MDATTLMTFLLQAPRFVSSVELIGSWDGFSKPYPLERDKRMGRGYWRGCHHFKGITCDGDTTASKASRDGGLLMGGTYWYYYRFDGDIEYYDPAQPYTNNCPLLPGQGVNILEVPIQVKSFLAKNDNASTSSFSSAIFTMDPQAKYLSPKPSVRRPAVSQSSGSPAISLASFSARFARLMARTIPYRSSIKCTSAEQLCTLSKPNFQKQRGTKSAGEHSSRPSGDPPVIGEPNLSCLVTDRTPYAKKIVTTILAKAATDMQDASSTGLPSDLRLHAPKESRAPPNTAYGPIQTSEQCISPIIEDEKAIQSPGYTATSVATEEYESNQNWCNCEDSQVTSARSSSCFSNDPCSLSYAPSTELTDSTSSRRFSQLDSPVSTEQDKRVHWTEDGTEVSVAFAVNERMKTSDEGLRLPSPRFLGYSLPEADQGSMLTIKPVPSNPFQPPDFGSPIHPNDSRKRVHTWNDGTEHPMTAFEELVDDLGYLSGLIN